MADEIKITLETLYDILRNEKKREDLQKLEDSFYIDVVSYLREKVDLLKSQQGQDNPFTAGSKEKLEYELRSIRRILKEIYEKREKKIIDIAMNRSRTGSDIIDTSGLMREEKDFYNVLLKNLDFYRNGIFWKLYNAQLPDVDETKRIDIKLKEPEKEVKKEVEENKEETKVVQEKQTPIDTEQAPPETPALNDGKEKETVHSNEPQESEKQVPQDKPEPEKQEEPTKNETPELEPKETIPLDKIKFLHAVPSFVWKDMKVYGPFEQGDETEIFPEVAALLVRKGRAEKV